MREILASSPKDKLQTVLFGSDEIAAHSLEEDVRNAFVASESILVGLLIYLSVAVEVAVGERVEVIELVHRPFSVPDERIEVAEC